MNPTLGDAKGGTDTGYNFRSSLAEYVRSQALPVDKLGHQPRLYALTRLVGRGLAYDDDVVYAAADRKSVVRICEAGHLSAETTSVDSLAWISLRPEQSAVPLDWPFRQGLGTLV